MRPAAAAPVEIAVRTVLFMCVFNATRTIMAEALLNHLGGGRYRAFSAGEYASGAVHPLTLECLVAHGIPIQGLQSKTWSRYIGLGAPHIDFIITVCDDSKEDMRRQWRQEPIKAHWDTANPAVALGTEEDMRRAFEYTFDVLKRRIEAFLQLPLDDRDPTAQWHAIMSVGKIR